MPAREAAGRPSVFITVGTDHHPFHRLIEWVDAWLESGGRFRVDCLIQLGTSNPARFAECRDYLLAPEMQAAMRDAAAVVCHGGPGTIMECRSLGLLPIVVPRQARLGEHVDDHQIRFARRMATTGGIHLAETEAQLYELLERVFVDPAAFRSEGVAPQLTATIRRFGELVDSLVAGVGERRRSRNRRRRQHAEGT